MALTCSILYRGLLDSCNYRCAYCSFAHNAAVAETIDADRRAIEHLIAWIRDNTTHRLAILFAPAGEALIHPLHRTAMEQLAAMPHVDKVAAQTNLSWPGDWPASLDPVVRRKLALWCTFHPTEVSADAFVKRLGELDELGIPCSVGAVGTVDHLPVLERLRRALPDHVYLWINAMRSQVPRYTASQLRRFVQLDPLFDTACHASLGRSCACGNSVISVQGGRIQRCFFVPEPIGHIAVDSLADVLEERPCPNDTCHCHIGYVHMPHLGLGEVFGEGVLERIPRRIPRPARR